MKFDVTLNGSSCTIPIADAPEKNSTIAIVPPCTEALAVTVTFPAVKTASFAGDVIATTGSEGGALTVTTTPLEVVESPFAAVACAVSVCVPAASVALTL